MKTLIMINGTMGAGKTTVCKALYQKLDRCVWLDGDWAWMMHPFQVNESTKRMVIDNITHLLKNFLMQESFDVIVFNWVMDDETIWDTILKPLSDLTFQLKKFTLISDDSVLIERLKKDIIAGIRREDCIEKSLARQHRYQHMDTVKIKTDGKSVNEITEEIIDKL